MTRKLLIVDDNRTNCEILKNMLHDEYEIAQAYNGLEALDIMEREYKRLSAVLLDIDMPVMDGFEVLARMSGSETLSELPVIVATGYTDDDSEEKALALGASDYISKPYKSAIIRRRVANIINLREAAATVSALSRDRLTGLYSREAFFEKAGEMVRAREPGHYVMACFDIDNFKVINDQYGTRRGDEVLSYIAKVFEQGFGSNGGICCRVTADNFAVLYPASFMGDERLDAIREKAAGVDGLTAPIAFSVGRYIVTDMGLTPSAMYDRATLAQDSVKGRYDTNTALYNESMRDYLLGEQRIVTEMDRALEERQFEVWFQPQYNHTKGALIGAEALVRWRHPEKGLIQPNVFIPIFEKNGFIYELDKFVWDEACRYLSKWQTEGRSPLPISVNVSRYDILRDDFVEALTGCLKRHGVPPQRLRLEITESAFAKSTKRIVEKVKRLIALGFTIEIDDFGSGYSSLNTLKSVPAQVVKLDMRFLENDDGSQRGGNIIESVVRMTKWLGMSVIAEGVETREQGDFLKSIGCVYVQGYLYARPMSAGDYERYCAGADKEERLLTIETVENLDNNSFWDPKSMDTLIFNSYVGGACIFEYHDGGIELIRATEKYAQVIGSAGMTVEEALKLNWSDHLDEATAKRVSADLTRSIDTQNEVTGEYVFLDLPGCPHETYLRSTMRVIATAGDRYLVYCTNENITAQRQAEQSEAKLVKQLKAIMDNVSCGITAVITQGEKTDILLANDRYFELLGYTREQFDAEMSTHAYDVIYAEDRPRVAQTEKDVLSTGDTQEIEYRITKRDGSLVWIRSSLSSAIFESVDRPVSLCTYNDITAEKLAAQELLDNLPCGAALYEYEKGEL